MMQLEVEMHGNAVPLKPGLAALQSIFQDFPRAKLQPKPAEKMKPTKVVTCEAPCPLQSKPPGAAWSSPDIVLALSFVCGTFAASFQNDGHLSLFDVTHLFLLSSLLPCGIPGDHIVAHCVVPKVAQRTVWR